MQRPAYDLAELLRDEASGVRIRRAREGQFGILHQPMFPSKPIAVIDTNVIVALYTVADITGSIEQQEPLERQHWRLRRAREALRLAIYLHEQEALTLSLHNEPIEQIQRLVQPGPNVKFAYTNLFLRFVCPELLDKWRGIGDARLFLNGNKADVELLRLAQECNVPLITFEGHTPDGVVDQKLRRRAKNVGAAVFTPGEFVAGRLAEEAVDRFIARYQERATDFSREDNYDHLQGHLDGLLGTLKRVLDRWPAL